MPWTVVTDNTASPPRRVLYGRRKGRRLRAGHRALVETLLPKIEIAADDTTPLDPGRLFGSAPAEIWLEIGFGAGEHLADQAHAHPEIGLIGCEPFLEGVAKLLSRIAAEDLGNIRLWRDDARLLLPRLPDNGIGRVFILFPDPWPKPRHHRRRIVCPAVLDELARVMPAGAELRVATDDPGYLVWMLEHLTRHPAFAWTARKPSDWRQRPADWPATRYEAKAVTAGRRPCYLTWRRLPLS